MLRSGNCTSNWQILIWQIHLALSLKSQGGLCIQPQSSQASWGRSLTLFISTRAFGGMIIQDDAGVSEQYDLSSLPFTFKNSILCSVSSRLHTFRNVKYEILDGKVHGSLRVSAIIQGQLLFGELLWGHHLYPIWKCTQSELRMLIGQDSSLEAVDALLLISYAQDYVAGHPYWPSACEHCIPPPYLFAFHRCMLRQAQSDSKAGGTLHASGACQTLHLSLQEGTTTNTNELHSMGKVRGALHTCPTIGYFSFSFTSQSCKVCSCLSERSFRSSLQSDSSTVILPRARLHSRPAKTRYPPPVHLMGHSWHPGILGLLPKPLLHCSKKNTYSTCLANSSAY